MKESWASQIEAWSEAVKAGAGGRVAQEMARRSFADLPRPLVAAFANLAWRANRPLLGLRATAPVIRRDSALAEETTPDVLTEHAACLIEIGARAEAKRILRAVLGKWPRARFALALLHFKEWEYAEAVPLLERYLLEIPDDYHAIVARVNLASAYVVVGKGERAQSLLNEIKPTLETSGRKLLLGNVHEIESQASFFAGDHEGALRLLERARGLLSESKNSSWLYCRKWIAINRAFLNAKAGRGSDSTTLQEELSLVEDARRMRGWETLRELDLFLGAARGDVGRTWGAYFGTPLTSYRSRCLDVMRMAGLSPSAPEAWTFGTQSDAVTLSDLVFEEKDSLRSFLPKRLLLALASERYAPIRTGEAFSELFGSERFDPETAPDRVFQAVKRLRVWLETRLPSASVSKSLDGYRLDLGDAGLTVGRELLEGSFAQRSDLRLIQLEDHFGERVFTAAESARKIGCSTRSANRLLRDLSDCGAVLKVGSGRATRFKIAS